MARLYAQVPKEERLRAANPLASAYQDGQRKVQSGAIWPQRIPASAGAASPTVANP